MGLSPSPPGWETRGVHFPGTRGGLKRRVAVRVLLLGIIFHANHILHLTRLGLSFLKLLTQSPENPFIILTSSPEDESFGPLVPFRRPVAEPGELMLSRGYHW